MSRGQDQGQVRPFSDRHRLFELSPDPGQQRHHPHHADHGHPLQTLPLLPWRQRCRADQGTHPPAGRSRLPDLPRSAHFGQQEPVAEGDLRREERQSLPHLPHARHKCSRQRQPPRRPRSGLRHLPHDPQRQAPIGLPENQFHLTKAAPALCVDCHDPNDAALQKTHHNQPFGTANCLSCHDPHQSAAPKLMAKFVHPPFADRNCELCHAPAKDGKVVLTQPDVKALCVTCHGDQAKLIETAKVQHPGAAGDCTDCHNPHASKNPGLPKTDPVNICLGCHTDQAEQEKKARSPSARVRAGLRGLPRTARQRASEAAAGPRQRALPGVSRRRLSAAKIGSPAPARPSSTVRSGCPKTTSRRTRHSFSRSATTWATQWPGTRFRM